VHSGVVRMDVIGYEQKERIIDQGEAIKEIKIRI
jgi:hypothetical protein